MSFYGNVTYYLSNAFNKIIYRNAQSASGNNASQDGTLGPGTPAYEYALQPRSRKDDTILETGNKWIVFADPKNTFENNQIRIFHQIVNDFTGEREVAPAEVAAPAQGTPTNDIAELSFGAILGIPTITYDNAGHIVTDGVKKFKLPVAQGELEINELKDRVAELENQMFGEHGETGPDTEIPEDPAGAVANRVASLEYKIGDWIMGDGTYQNLNPIGQTLNELQFKVGVKAREYDSNTDTYRYRDVTAEDQSTNTDYKNNTALGIVQTANNTAVSGISYAIANRQALNKIIEYVQSESGLNANIPDLTPLFIPTT